MKSIPLDTQKKSPKFKREDRQNTPRASVYLRFLFQIQDQGYVYQPDPTIIEDTLFKTLLLHVYKKTH